MTRTASEHQGRRNGLETRDSSPGQLLLQGKGLVVLLILFTSAVTGIFVFMGPVGLCSALILACLFLFLCLYRSGKENAFLAEVIESTPHPVRVIDPRNFRILMENSVGRRRQQSSQTTCHAALFQSSAPCTEADRPCPVALVKRTGMPTCVEHRVDGKDGPENWTEVQAFPVFSARGKLGKVIEHFVDITKPKEAERELEARARALRESEERHRLMVENANDAIFVLQDSRIVFHNRKTEEMVGRSGEELRSRTFLEFIAPEDRTGVAERHLRRLQGETFQDVYPFRVTHTSGEMLWVEVSSVLVDWEGSPATLCFIRDINDRRTMEEKVRASDEKLQCIGAQAQDAILMIDGKGDLSFWNEAAERIFGYTAEEVLGRNLHRLLTPDRFHHAHFSAYRRFQETGEGAVIGRTLELAALKKNGEEIPVELSLSAFKLRGEWNAIGILRDITDRKRIEEELRQAKERAENTSMAKSQFLANMSHEIRTPLNGIIGMTGLALKTDLTDEQTRYLEAVTSSSDHLLGILNDILDLSKIEADRLETEEIDFDLRSAIEFTLDQVAFKAHEKDLELLCEIRPDVPSAVIGDPGRLRQILLNLLNNAIKFTESGEVTLNCSAGADEGGTVELHCKVSDTGIGIPQDKQDRIFEVFLQADGSMTRRFGGTGLGLPISKALCEQMGGTMWMESEPGKGSTFHFSIILGRQIRDVRGEQLPSHDPLKGKRVLIVDKNAERRRILAEMVAPWGAEPETAGDGDATRERLSRATGQGLSFDLLVVDSGVSSWALAALPGREDGGKKSAKFGIVLLTDTVRRASVPHEDEGRIAARVCKPVKQSELLNALLSGLVGDGRPHPGRSDVGAELETSDPLPNEKGLKILLAEDNQINQLMAIKTLEMFGHTVTLAENGSEAVDLVREESFDLVLMDGQMPVMDGQEATRVIRSLEQESGTRLPILAMTAHAMKGDRERFLAAGMDDYIAKPIDPERLREMLERWRNRKDQSMSTHPQKPEASGRSDDEMQETIPVNLEKALARACGDKAFLEEMIRHFVEDIDGQLDRLRSVIEEGDATGLAKQAHALKGSAATLGASRIASVALQLEETGKGEDLANGEQLLFELADEMARLTDYVGRPDWLEVS